MLSTTVTVVSSAHTYLLDCNSSSVQRYISFEQLGPEYYFQTGPLLEHILSNYNKNSCDVHPANTACCHDEWDKSLS